MDSNLSNERRSRGVTARTIDRQRRRFLALLGAGALAAAGAPEVTAQDDEDAREPDMGDVTVTTRDNIDLATDVYLPSESGSFPTIVYRTPYGKAINSSYQAPNASTDT